MDKVRGPSKLVTNGPEAQNENKHSSPDKIGRLQICLCLFVFCDLVVIRTKYCFVFVLIVLSCLMVFAWYLSFRI